jgi:hypothetical protein
MWRRIPANLEWLNRRSANQSTSMPELRKESPGV